MKKLIIAVAAVAMGIAANAASYSWQVQKGYIYDGAATPEKITSGTAYLMFTSVLSQSDLVTAFGTDAAAAAATVAANAISTGAIGSNARVALVEGATYDTTSDQTAYFVVFNNDAMYVSITKDALYDALTGDTIAFDSVTSSSKLKFDVADGYSAAGWYAAVPEPTSGLLMLLGMAGLALRRRRA